MKIQTSRFGEVEIAPGIILQGTGVTQTGGVTEGPGMEVFLVMAILINRLLMAAGMAIPITQAPGYTLKRLV